MRSNTAIRSLAIFLACTGLPASPALAEEEPAANPYRPSVGSPASLSAPGHFEIEAGFARETAPDARLDGMPMLLKYAFTERFGVTFGISPWLRASTPEGTTSGNGDGTITLKVAQPVSEAFMVGGELTASLPVASNGLGLKHSYVTLNLIASGDFAGFHGDVNVNSTRLGEAQEPGITRQVTGWSVGVSHPLSAQFGVGLEASGLRQSGVFTSTQLLASVSYSVSTKLVLDVYAARARVGDIHIDKFGGGFTYLFAR